MKKRTKNTKRKNFNPVAKFARVFNRACKMRDRTKYSRKNKNNKQEQE